MENVHQQTELILLGDINSREGCKDEDVVGRFREISVYDKGKRLIELCKDKCIITNTIFQHIDIHKFTWEEK